MASRNSRNITATQINVANKRMPATIHPTGIPLPRNSATPHEMIPIHARQDTTSRINSFEGLNEVIKLDELSTLSGNLPSFRLLRDRVGKRPLWGRAGWLEDFTGPSESSTSLPSFTHSSTGYPALGFFDEFHQVGNVWVVARVGGLE